MGDRYQISSLSSAEPYLEGKVQAKETKIFQSSSHGESPRAVPVRGSPQDGGRGVAPKMEAEG